MSAALVNDQFTDYGHFLDRFVEEHRGSLHQLYDDYGLRSGLATSSDYVLWSQPESLAVLESLENRKHTLAAAFLEAELPTALVAIARRPHLGRPRSLTDPGSTNASREASCAG